MMQQVFDDIDYDYLAGILLGYYLINFKAVNCVLEAYMKAIKNTRHQLEICTEMPKSDKPHKKLIKCAITLGNFFPFLYGAMRDDPKGFFY